MDVPLGNIITAIATVGAVVVANKLSSSATGLAKIWELRRQSYSVILSELASVERLGEVVESYMDENVHAYFESDQRGFHDERCGKHMSTVQQRFSDDYLILSDNFIMLFSKFQDDLESGDPDEIFPEERKFFFQVIRKHRPLLLEQARKEVSIRRNFLRIF